MLFTRSRAKSEVVLRPLPERPTAPRLHGAQSQTAIASSSAWPGEEACPERGAGSSSRRAPGRAAARIASVAPRSGRLQPRPWARTLHRRTSPVGVGRPFNHHDGQRPRHRAGGKAEQLVPCPLGPSIGAVSQPRSLLAPRRAWRRSAERSACASRGMPTIRSGTQAPRDGPGRAARARPSSGHNGTSAAWP